MSGVITNDTQWERCSCCNKWIRLADLGYEHPSAQFEYGRDLCIDCANTAPDLELIDPAKSWVAQYE